MPSPKPAILIENNSHRVLEFSSVRALKKWAKNHGWRIRRSWASDLYDIEVYYTDSYVTLPT